MHFTTSCMGPTAVRCTQPPLGLDHFMLLWAGGGGGGGYIFFFGIFKASFFLKISKSPPIDRFSR